jgi:hypothetical protein
MASIVNPSVVEVLTAGFLPQEASLSVQPTVEVKHSHFYCYGSESGDSDKSICNSEVSESQHSPLVLVGAPHKGIASP